LRRLALPTTPVVHEDEAEDVLVGALDGHRVPEAGRGATNEEGHLQLKVHEPAGPEHRVGALHGQGLPVGSADVRPGDDNGRSPAVVAHWHVFPVPEFWLKSRSSGLEGMRLLSVFSYLLVELGMIYQTFFFLNVIPGFCEWPKDTYFKCYILFRIL